MTLRFLAHGAAALAVALSCLGATAARAAGGMPPEVNPANAASPAIQQEPAGPDPQRWQPVARINGGTSYFDQTAVRRRGNEVGVVVMRNAPAGVIRTTSGEQIRSSVKRIVLDCTGATYSVVEQTLYPRRYARGEPLYTMHPPRAGVMQTAASGSLASELIAHLCN